MSAQRHDHRHAQHAAPSSTSQVTTADRVGASVPAKDTGTIAQQASAAMKNNEVAFPFVQSLADRIKEGRRRGTTKTANKDAAPHTREPTTNTTEASSASQRSERRAAVRPVVKSKTNKSGKVATRNSQPKPTTPKRHNLRGSMGTFVKATDPASASPAKINEGEIASPATSEASTLIDLEVAEVYGLPGTMTTSKRPSSEDSTTLNDSPRKRARLSISTSAERMGVQENDTSSQASSPLSELDDDDFTGFEALQTSTSALRLASLPKESEALTQASAGQQDSPEFSPLTPFVQSFALTPMTSGNPENALHLSANSQDVNATISATDTVPVAGDATSESEPISAQPTSAAATADSDKTTNNASPSLPERTTFDASSHTMPAAVHPRQLNLTRPDYDPERDLDFRNRMIIELKPQADSDVSDVQRRQARRILELLKVAKPPGQGETGFLSGPEAAQRLRAGVFDNFPIFTEAQQPSPLQSIEEFLEEFYDDGARVSIQDPAAYETDEDEGAKRSAQSATKKQKKVKQVREVTIRELKGRFSTPPTDNKPWNCLELATPADEGYRPQFLNSEDCRLLTKLKMPGDGKKTSRRDYHDGYKEVEKWALLGQAALTEPHQDSHGYSTYITVNEGLIGYGWLSNPTEQERSEWGEEPMRFLGGRWRYVIMKPGQTVYFPAGTVHFVFRMPSGGNTLSFGGHVMRCSNILHWMKVLRVEKENRYITNEDLELPVVRNYLARVERYVKQAEQQGKLEKWGGEEAVKEFLALKKEFLKR